MDGIKVGSLVRCLFQPGTACIEHGFAVPMKHIIKGQLGIYIEHRDSFSGTVLFPQFGGYTHTLSWGVLEGVS